MISLVEKAELTVYSLKLSYKITSHPLTTLNLLRPTEIQLLPNSTILYTVTL